MRIKLNLSKVLGLTLDIPGAPVATQITLGTMVFTLVGAVVYWLFG